MKALRFTCRFALPPNSLGYCGKESAPEKFKNCILGKGCWGVSGEIEKFIVLNPYLETISKIIKKDKFDYKVTEAYWFGNESLEKIKNSDYDLLLKNFAKQGVPSWFVDELTGKKPKRFIPTHLFQVLHIGVGKASGSVPYNIKTINNCMIRWGKVMKLGKKKLTVNLNSLKKSKGKFGLIKQEGTFKYKVDLLTGLKKGDYVAVHWNRVVKRLSSNEVQKLEYWSRVVVASSLQ